MSALSYAVAVFLSVVAHGLLIFLMTYGWQQSTPEIEIRRPQVIQASLVELEAKAPPKPPENNVIDLTEQRRREAEELARQEAERKRIAAENKAKEEAEKKRLEEERLRKEREEREEQEKLEEAQRLAAEAAERRRIEEFNQALSEEEGYEASVASQEIAASVSALIRQQVVEQWSPPPSARREMVAVLRVTMVPTGRVVQVDVIEGSGNDAFDRSVVSAVQKAQPFESVKTLESAVFEQNFREFRFRFTPQSLRL